VNPALGMLSMLFRENWIAGDLQREPEELLVMDTQDQVSAWHEQGKDDGPIVPIYHLNALACSRLAPTGGTVVDLGCGSGQYAAYLARRRPDLKVVGFDLSEPMVATGNAALCDAGLADRVELRVGDMTAFSERVPDDVVLIGSVFSIHHLPTLGHVERCFREMAAARRRLGCAVWVFDLARPRHRQTALAYPEVFTPEAPRAFKEDSINSLIAAYSHTEMDAAIRASLSEGSLVSRRSRFLPLYQAFWMESGDNRSAQSSASAAVAGPAAMTTPLSASVRARYRALRWILPGLPE
jgi:arsenite methyltransferase